MTAPLLVWRDPPPRRRLRHGTRDGYNQGCICAECRAANNGHSREWYRKNKGKYRHMEENQ